MKKIILTVSVIAAMSTSVVASEAKNVTIRDVYVNQTTDVPEVVRSCYNVDVPVYETYERRGSAAEAITGGIIGGAIGNQFGKGSGNDVMTVLGVIAGLNSADRQESRVAGYRKERRCSDDIYYRPETKRAYSHSVIEFERDGIKYYEEFIK